MLHSTKPSRHFIQTHIAACFIFGVVLFLGVFSQTHAIESPSSLLQTKTQLNELFKVQDDTSISAEEKEVKEISLRRNILNNIITIARAQADDAFNRLNSLSFDDKDPWKPVQKSVLSRIADAQSYYQKTASHLATDTALTVDDLKNIAKDLDLQKSDSIDPAVKEGNTISALFHIGALLDVADDRLNKIGTDVDKIYSQKLTTDSAMRTLFNKATKLLKETHASYDNTSDVLFHLYDDSNSTSSSTYATNLYKNLVDQKIINAISPVTTTPSSTASEREALDFSLRKNALDTYLQKSLADIVDSIKGTYDIFLQMSAQVKEYLK